MMLCQPTGGLARLTEGCSFRRKAMVGQWMVDGFFDGLWWMDREVRVGP